MTDQAQVVAERQPSTRLLRKGALVEETYVAFKHFDLRASWAENLSKIRRTNPIGAPNQAWLREVLVTISSRFGLNDDHLPLVRLARANFPLDKWRSFLLWHIGHTDVLFYRFATEWLFEEFLRGTYSIRSEALAPFVSTIITSRGAQTDSYKILINGGSRPVAYFLVDSLRYEMAMELASQLSDAKDLVVRPCVGVLPSITPIGMAALLPGASATRVGDPEDAKRALHQPLRIRG